MDICIIWTGNIINFFYILGLIVATYANELWIMEQVQFRLGHWYDAIASGRLNVTKMTEEPTHGVRFTLNDLHNESIYWRHKEVLQLALALVANLSNKVIFYADYNDNQQGSSNAPVFSFNRPFRSQSTILMPVMHYFSPAKYEKLGRKDVAFEEKADSVVFRGVTTGPITADDIRCFSRKYVCWSGMEKNNRLHIIETYFLKEGFDVGFSKIAQNEHWNDSVYARVRSVMKPPLNLTGMLQHKYTLCLEGNDWSSTFFWALASNSCPIHTYPFTSENILFSGLIPWVHFIPINIDGSDLLSKFKWCLKYPSICKNIADNGKLYMRPFMNATLYSVVLANILHLYSNQAWSR